MARQESTEINYRAIGRRLLARFKRESGSEWRDDPLALIDWFIDHRPGWRPRTWWYYKQCLKAVLSDEGAPIEAMDLLDQSKEMPNLLGKSAHHRAVKRVKADVLDRYLRALHGSKSPLAHLLAAFLLVNTEIGLRPIEWGEAQIIGNLLDVRNAKNSNGRATGVARQLILEESLRDKVSGAFLLRDVAVKRYGSWAETVVKLRKTMKDTRRYYTLPSLHLYSTRHQFAANAKSAGYSTREIADMMGHHSEATATRSYGRKLVGRGGLLVSPVASGIQPKPRLSFTPKSKANKPV